MQSVGICRDPLSLFDGQSRREQRSSGSLGKLWHSLLAAGAAWRTAAGHGRSNSGGRPRFPARRRRHTGNLHKPLAAVTCALPAGPTTHWSSTTAGEENETLRATGPSLAPARVGQRSRPGCGGSEPHGAASLSAAVLRGENPFGHRETRLFPATAFAKRVTATPAPQPRPINGSSARGAGPPRKLRPPRRCPAPR